jgi:hypothetical protein
MVAPMTMPAVHEEVHEYAAKQQHIRERCQHMCTMFGPKKEGGNHEEDQ